VLKGAKMSDENYERILDKISKTSGVARDELERRVEAKRSKLSGLISKEGAAQVIAAELGISFDNEKLKIDELLPGMRKINFVAKVINTGPIRTFTTKSGVESKVTNLVVADETSNIKVVLWDTNHIEMIEKGIINQESVVEIGNASIRDGEIHLGSFSDLKLSKEILENVKKEKTASEKGIKDFRIGDSPKTRAFIVQAFEPRFFHVCPVCKKKVVSGIEGFICTEHGKVVSEKRALMNFVIDDGSENIRAVAFHESLKNLGITELDNQEILVSQKQGLLGKEMVFSGNVRMNKFFNHPELIIDGINDVDFDSTIAALEKN
jgi:replication factor A1